MSSRHLLGARCSRCQKNLPGQAARCSNCGSQGQLILTYDHEDAARTLDRSSLERREPWMWRFKELLPLEDWAQVPPLQVGMTPVWGTQQLAKWIGITGLWLKDEGREPTGSIEDRASALVVTQAIDAQKATVAVVSISQEGPSLACLAASMGVNCLVLAPPQAPMQSLIRAEQYGALVFQCPQSVDELWASCDHMCEQWGWINGSAQPSPLPWEGKKTAGLEIGEQLCERPPDWIALNTGNASQTLLSVWDGLEQIHSLGILPALPKVLVAIPSSSSSLSYEEKRVVEKSEGASITVELEELHEAQKQISRQAGVLIDDNSSRALAGLKKAVQQEIVSPSQTALVLIEGQNQELSCQPRIHTFSSWNQLETEVQARGFIRSI